MALEARAQQRDTGRSEQAKPSCAAPRVLLVEDEPGIVDFLERGLTANGFEVESCLDGAEGERVALSGTFDAIVLDLMLPTRSGLEILTSVRRAEPSLPVIVLSARGQIEDRVAGLEGGALDYLVKPFSLAELIARLRAQLRFLAHVSERQLSADDIELDLLTRKVHRAGQLVALSATEFDLLAYLVRHRGQVLSREEILGAVWGYEHDPATNVVDVYVGYLRRKLTRPGNPAPIDTIRTVGYRLSTGSSTRAD
jgi:DNA-binding response OmpR family regulator